jgi:hypothetical protein
MDNFASALNNIWPNLVQVRITGWDAWDRVAERLYSSLVAESFAYKFGLEEDELDLADYGTFQPSRSSVEVLVKREALEPEMSEQIPDRPHYFHSYSNETAVDLSLPSNFSYREETIEPEVGDLDSPEEMTFTHVIAVDETGTKQLVVPRS